MTQAKSLPYSLSYDRLSRTWSIVDDRREPVQSGLTHAAASAEWKERNRPFMPTQTTADRQAARREASERGRNNGYGWTRSARR